MEIFVSRSLGMIERYFEGVVPNPAELSKNEKEIENFYRETARQVSSDLEELAFKQGAFPYMGIHSACKQVR